MVAPSLRRSPIARSTMSMLSSSALANSFLFMYSRITPIRRPSSPRARHPRRAFGVVRIAEGPAERAARAIGRVLRHIGFREDNRAGVAQPLDEGRIVRRTVVRVLRVRARRGAHIEGVVLILDRHHD